MGITESKDCAEIVFDYDCGMEIGWTKYEHKMQRYLSHDIVDEKDYVKVKTLLFRIYDRYIENPGNKFPNLPRCFPNAKTIAYFPMLIKKPFDVIPEYVTEIYFRTPYFSSPIKYSEDHKIKKISISRNIVKHDNFSFPPSFDSLEIFSALLPETYPNVKSLLIFISIPIVAQKHDITPGCNLTEGEILNPTYNFENLPVTLEKLGLRFIHSFKRYREKNGNKKIVVLDNLPPLLKEIVYTEDDDEDNIEITYNPSLERVTRNKKIIYSKK